MSYDLVVFDPDAAPTDRESFLKWYDSHNNDTDLFDPVCSAFSTPGLRSWLDEILKTFPAVNGPLSDEDQDVDDSHLTDYGINRTHICGCFAWSVAESAYNCVMSLAEKHGVGVYDISDSAGKIWRPGIDGRLC